MEFARRDLVMLRKPFLREDIVGQVFDEEAWHVEKSSGM